MSGSLFHELSGASCGVTLVKPSSRSRLHFDAILTFLFGIPLDLAVSETFTLGGCITHDRFAIKDSGKPLRWHVQTGSGPLEIGSVQARVGPNAGDL